MVENSFSKPNGLAFNRLAILTQKQDTMNDKDIDMMTTPQPKADDSPPLKRIVIQPGDRVSWTYRHNLNSKSYTYITKEGTVKKVYEDRGFAKVHFDGNRTLSAVDLTDLEKVV